jgi:GntR family transcriptional regulator
MDFDQNKPIYLQIIDDFKKKIIRGELKPGDKILSQRDFAREINVNPNTVQRAYREMESLGLVMTLRGQGTFITEDKDMLMRIKDETATEIIKNFIQGMNSLGFEGTEVLDLIQQHLERETNHDRIN